MAGPCRLNSNRSSGCAAPRTPVRPAAVSPGPPSARSTRPPDREEGPVTSTSTDRAGEPPPTGAGSGIRSRAASATSRAIRAAPSSSVNEASASRADFSPASAPAVAQLLAVARAWRQRRQPAAIADQDRHGPVAGLTFGVGPADVSGAHEHGAAIGRNQRIRQPQRGQAVARRRRQLGAEQSVAEAGDLRDQLGRPAFVVRRRDRREQQRGRRRQPFAAQAEHGLGRERHRVVVVVSGGATPPARVGVRSAGSAPRPPATASSSRDLKVRGPVCQTGGFYQSVGR